MSVYKFILKSVSKKLLTYVYIGYIIHISNII